MKIYVASSWRNMLQPAIVHILRGMKHEVYDFRRPSGGDKDDGFSWSEIDQKWQTWTQEEYLNALEHSCAQRGFSNDLAAMEWADVGLLVLGAGASAHLELGWFAGNPDKRSIILLAPPYDDEEAKEYLKGLGHSMCARACAPCGDIGGCWLKDNFNDDTGYRRRQVAVKQTPFEPELMYKMADAIVGSVDDALDVLEAFEIDDKTQEE